MRILNFGSCNIDYVYTVEHIVVPGETITGKQMEIFPGGKGLNQSIAIARAGSKVYHAGYIGTDGEWLRTLLEENGADVSFLQKTDEKNGHAIIQVSETGENSIFLYPGSNRMLTEEYVEAVLSGFSAGDILVLQNEVNLVDFIIRKAYQKGMTIFFNPAPFTQDLKSIDFHMISYLVLNEIEAASLSGLTDIFECVEYFSKTYPDTALILTLGRQGCIYRDRTQYLSHPAFCVEAVDTTAAGDTFTGYLIAMIAQGKKSLDAVHIASAASALAVSRMGAATSIPQIAEVTKALLSLKPYQTETNTREQKLRGNIEQYMESHLSNAKLSELANELGYSDAYTGKLVKSVTLHSFSELLQKKRCAKAAKLLCETDLTIGEIIHHIGYENESFFRKIFQKEYGENPWLYRKQRCREELK